MDCINHVGPHDVKEWRDGPVRCLCVCVYMCARAPIASSTGAVPPPQGYRCVSTGSARISSPLLCLHLIPLIRIKAIQKQRRAHAGDRTSLCLESQAIKKRYLVNMALHNHAEEKYNYSPVIRIITSNSNNMISAQKGKRPQFVFSE